MEIDQTSDEAFAPFLRGGNQEDDRNLLVEFFVDKKLMGKKSEDAKRPVYEDREYVRIVVKGQKHQVVVDEVRETHKNRFPIAYHRFQLKKPAPVIGTPIEQLPNMSPALAGELKLLGLRAIEDVARITDDQVVQSIGLGARDLIKRAKAYIENTSGENVELRNAIADGNAKLEAEVAKRKELEERLAALESKPAKRKYKRRANPDIEAP